MKKDKKADSPSLTLFPVLLVLLCSVSCTPLLIGQAAIQGTKLTAAVASSALTQEDHKKLKDSVEAFNQAFRFQDYKQASAFVSLDKKENFWSEADRFNGKIRMTEYEIRDIQVDEKTNQASVIMSIQYWRMASPILQTISFKQKWQYFEKDKSWKVNNIGFEAITSNSD